MKTVIIIMLIILAVVAGLGWYMAGFSLGIVRQTLEGARKWQEDHYDLSWYDAIDKTDYTVESYDGYILHAQFLPCPEHSDKYMIITHGYTDNRFGALKYTKMYLDLGFNVVVYDLRGHGLNDATFCTYSIRESKDLNVLIEDTRKRYEGLKVLGLHGESLGGASTIAVLKYKPQVDFAVDDCGFSDIAEVLKGSIRHMHLPAFVVDIASVAAKVRYGYSYKEMRPIEALKDADPVPVLFIHGDKDELIPPSQGEEMSKAAPGYTEYHTIKGASHAMSVLMDPGEYRRIVESFLKTCKVL